MQRGRPLGAIRNLDIIGRMRILFVTQWFDPEPMPKGVAFARELQRLGHSVEVLTGFPNYPDGRLYPGYRMKAWQRESLDGVPVLRVPLIPSHSRSAVGRVANYGSFALSASIAGALAVSTPDVVYAYHPPPTIGLPALAVRQLRGAPYVLDVQDLWPDTLAATGMVRNPAVLRLADRFSRFVYRQAERVVALSPGMRDRLVEYGVAPERADVIYNWCDEAAIGSAGSLPPPPSLAALSGRLKIIFAGTMGLAQGLDTVLDCAARCATLVPQAAFVFVGGGADRDRLERRSAELGLANVSFLPRVSMAEVGAVLAAADVLLVHLKDDPLFRMTIPSKTQAYMAAGRPMIMAVRGDAADLVQRAGCGWVCTPGDAEELAAQVEAAARVGPAGRAQMGEAGRAFYSRELSLGIGVKKFEAVLALAARTGSRSRRTGAAA